MKKLARRLIAPLLTERGPRGRIYLTFDDGPHPEGTPRILDALDAHGVKATFFMVGAAIEQHAGLARDVAARGHSLGYHSYDHVHAVNQTLPNALHDLRNMRVLEGKMHLTGRIALYRPPYGELTVSRLLWCLAHRVKIVMWSLDSLDWKSASSEEVAARVAPQLVCDGDVILFHDDALATPAALPRIIERLKAAGFVFGTL